MWLRCIGGGLGGLELQWQVNVIKNAFKFLLQLLILSQKNIQGVKKVVWDGLEVVWSCFGLFGVLPRTLTGRIIHKNISFRG